ATRLKVQEQQSRFCLEQIAGMRLSVQELRVCRAVDYCVSEASQRVPEKHPVFGTKVRSRLGVADHRLGRGHPVCERRPGALTLPHAGMQSLQCLGVPRRGYSFSRHGLVVGPQRDSKAITQVNPRLYSRLELRHRAIGLSEPPSEQDLER